MKQQEEQPDCVAAYFDDFILYGVAPLLVVGALGLIEKENRSGEWKEVLRPTLGVTLGMATTKVLTAVVKRTMRRPRPYTYAPKYRAANPDQHASASDSYSFFSGHTSMTAAAAFGAASALHQNTDLDSEALVGAYVGAAILTTLVAYLRIRASKHFYSDVVVGGAVGALFGALGPIALR